MPPGPYCTIELPPKLPNHPFPSLSNAAPHAPPFMPLPVSGDPKVGVPVGLSTVTYSLGFLVPGSQLLLDHTLPAASIAIRPEAYRSGSV